MGKYTTKEDIETNGIPTIYVGSVEEFDQLRRLTVNGPIKVILTNNIDLNGHEKAFEPIDLSYFHHPIVIDGRKEVIGYRPLYGGRDDKYTISNMAVFGADNVGLIGELASSITIVNIKFVNCVAIGSSHVGTIIGKGNDVSIKNCEVENGTVIGCNVVGGLVGKSLSLKTTDVLADIHTEGNKYVGGICGIADKVKTKHTIVIRPTIYKDVDYKQKIAPYSGIVGYSCTLEQDRFCSDACYNVNGNRVVVKKHEKRL